MKLKELSEKLPALNRQITILFPIPTALLVKRLVHQRNQLVYETFKSAKDNKLKNLCKVNTPPSNNTTDLDKKFVVCIPDSIKLSPSETSVLSKGLKFIPLMPSTSKYQTTLDLERFYRCLRFTVVLQNVPRPPIQDDIFLQLFKEPTRHPPPENRSVELEYFISKTKREIAEMQTRPLQSSNLSTDEISALNSLRKRQDIVIKPADKGGAIVVWDRNLYIQEALRQLQDNTFYQSIPASTLTTDSKLISKTIKTAIDEEKLPHTARLLNKSRPKQPSFYLLPKIHKAQNPGRPIVSAVSCPTEHLSQYLDTLLQPIVHKLPSFLKDTNDTLTMLENFKSNPPFSPSILYTMDVCSLYTSIPHQDGLQALKFFLDKRVVKIPPTDILLRLAELVLTMNSFEFNGEYFHQISGVAMGTKMGPSYACLFMGHLESSIAATYQGPLPELYKRYIDDCFGATTLTENEFLNYYNYAQNFHPSISFTYELSTEKVTFLDIDISLVNDSFETSVHYKTTDSHSYLKYSSSNPISTKNSIPYSQFLRLKRLCSDPNDFVDKAAEMANFFRQRSYPQNVIDEALEKVNNIPRTTALIPTTSQEEPMDRPVLVLTHHPHNIGVKRIVSENWKILSDSPVVGSLFSKPPLYASRRERNLRDILVQSKLHSGQTKPPGTFPCQLPNCLCCAYISNSINVQFPLKPFKIKKNFSCTSSNIIYAILCTKCPQIYIGETERSLATRFKEHHANVRLNRELTVGPHFNSRNHSIDSMRIMGLWNCYTLSSCDRKYLESKFIENMGTHEPHGLNRKI